MDCQDFAHGSRSRFLHSRQFQNTFSATATVEITLTPGVTHLPEFLSHDGRPQPEISSDWYEFNAQTLGTLAAFDLDYMDPLTFFGTGSFTVQQFDMLTYHPSGNPFTVLPDGRIEMYGPQVLIPGARYQFTAYVSDEANFDPTNPDMTRTDSASISIATPPVLTIHVQNKSLEIGQTLEIDLTTAYSDGLPHFDSHVLLDLNGDGVDDFSWNGSYLRADFWEDLVGLGYGPGVTMTARICANPGYGSYIHDYFTVSVAGTSTSQFVESSEPNQLPVAPAPPANPLEQVINSFLGQPIVPMKVGDLPLKIQQAMFDTSGNLRMTAVAGNSTNVNIFNISNLTVETVAGPYRYQDGQEWAWANRLLQEENRHRGTVYYDVFGVHAFFTKLILASRGLRFFAEANPNANATYHALNHTVGIPVPIEQLKIDTVIHESTHALDNLSGWYLPLATPANIDKIEALGWTAQHLSFSLNVFKTRESAILNSTDPDSVASSWHRLVKETNDIYASSYTYRIGQFPESTQNLGQAQIDDFISKVGFKFRMGTLAAAYQQRLMTRGIPGSFEIMDVANRFGLTAQQKITNNENEYTVPPVFRE